LPVVDRNQPTRLLGMLSRSSIATAYRSTLDEEDAIEPSALTAHIDVVRQRMRGRRRAAVD